MDWVKIVLICWIGMIISLVVSSSARVYSDSQETDFDRCVDYCQSKIHNEVVSELVCLKMCIDMVECENKGAKDEIKP